jgi:ankyrin repeat protein
MKVVWQGFRHTKPSALVVVLVTIAVALAGCRNSSPQYQVIPAVIRGDVEAVKALLSDSENVDINWTAGGRGSSALSTAAASNQIAIAQLLLDRGADPNIASQWNETPLQAAAYHGNTEILKLLIDAGARLDTAETQYGFTALASAARNGHMDAIKLLLDAGADRSLRIKDGRTAKQLAEQYNHLNAAQLLR